MEVVVLRCLHNHCLKQCGKTADQKMVRTLWNIMSRVYNAGGMGRIGLDFCGLQGSEVVIDWLSVVSDEFRPWHDLTYWWCPGICLLTCLHMQCLVLFKAAVRKTLLGYLALAMTHWTHVLHETQDQQIFWLSLFYIWFIPSFSGKQISSQPYLSSLFLLIPPLFLYKLEVTWGSQQIQSASCRNSIF